MMPALPQLRVGEPIRHEAIAVFPLFSDASDRAEYRLADEALADKSVTVEETSSSGCVFELLVKNLGDVRVLFLEGDQLVGAKQNRVLNTSVMVAAGSRIKIPVSCVEQGRWRSTSQFFVSSDSHSSNSLRGILRRSVSRSLKEQSGHRSDQAAVWKEIANLQQSQGVRSSSADVADIYAAFRKRIATCQESLKYVPGARGWVVAIGPRISMLDLFDQPPTCEHVWSRFLSGVFLDALAENEAQAAPTLAEVARFIARIEELNWSRTESVGEGDEYRSETEFGEHAAALVLAPAVIHASVVMAV